MKRIYLSFAFVFAALISFGQKPLTGTITVVKAKVFTMKCEGTTDVFSKGDSCSISKDISGNKNPFGINISNGWLGVGKGVITALDKSTITVKVVKETSNIVINGKKTEHFVPGKKIRLE